MLSDAARPMITLRFDASRAELGELKAECVQRGQHRSFLHDTFEKRDRQLFPRDLLLALTPTKKGGFRTVGVLRRSLRYNKEENRRIVYVDFIYVLKSNRGQGIGRKLLECAMLFGKVTKPVGLIVAGSESNVPATALYKSLGFQWVDDTCAEMLAPESAVVQLAAMRSSPTDPTTKAEVVNCIVEGEENSPADAADVKAAELLLAEHVSTLLVSADVHRRT
ncbi:hypothetical protein T492DRAFT_846893 [Pavlovales sp. CCMP2436]|nr:hypothetical protein T492DRAFT_846893 [Pavlovales sp. CCMP2436]